MVLVVVLWVSASSPSPATSPGKLRYALQQDQTVGYRIEIIADRDDATETLQGVVTYKCKSAEKDVLQLTYAGGLSKSSKAKPSEGRSRFGAPPFGPRMFGPSRAFGPFSNTLFKGLITTTNDLTLTSLGEIQSMQGDSQLPYLLGNASLLIFEPLPEQAEESWSVTTGISITEEGGRRGLPYRLPFEPESPKRTTTGSEIHTYRVRSIDGPRIIVDKTYRLDSPAVNKDVSGFEINGTGTWTFNRELGISESLELKQKLIFQKGNTTTAIPMTIKYNRLSEAELTAHQEEQKQKQEEAKKRLAEIQEKQANTPLTEQEIRKVLEGLESDSVTSVLMALQKLQQKNPQNSDPRIALAVDALKEHENSHVKQIVKIVAEKWPLPEGVLSVAAKKRTWSDSSGTFTVVAEFLALEGDTVRLKRSDDGKELEVPLSRLSEADQKAARELAKVSKPVVKNPFE
jgi:hypothetical protein